MPRRRSRSFVPAVLGAVLALGGAATARAQSELPQTPSRVENSALDAPLFYQLLIGEIELREGNAGVAYEAVLDAARRTKDEQLFRRATEIALQARAGNEALAAAQAWLVAAPRSFEAHRFVVQLLLAMNRASETVEPVRSLLALTPEVERPATIASLPRLYARGSDRKLQAELVQQVLVGYLDAPATRVASEVALGRAWLAADDSAKALDLATRASREDPAAEGPALLALDLMATQPSAEALVRAHLATQPKGSLVRLGYARVLAGAQRHADALEQVQAMTAAHPEVASGWLMIGALQIELHRPREATDALKRFLTLASKPEATATGTEGVTVRVGVDGADTEDRGVTQAQLMLAQAAEQMGDFKAAEAWLAKIDDPKRALEVQTRRASILARQGRVAEGRALIRATPENDDDDARAKVLAEVSLLRDAKQWQAAEDVLAAGNQRFTDDVGLLYEQAMVAEKLDRVDEMERLLRRVIALKPDHQHAYNALGYSLAERNQRLPEARELIRKALALAPGEPFITDSLGWVEYRMGNLGEAQRLLESAYKARPDPEIAAHLGEVLWVSGRRDEARRVWREGRGRDAGNEVLRDTLARLRVDL